MNTKTGSILIADNNEKLPFDLQMLLDNYFFRVDTISRSRQLLQQLDIYPYDLILLDMNFGNEPSDGNDDLYWMGRIIKRKPAPSVILITAHSEAEHAIRGVEHGAVDFILKSWDNERILSTIRSALRMHRSKQKINILQQKQKHLANYIDRNHTVYRGISSAMGEVYRMIEKSAPTNANILLLGENGTGKEVLAREIHRLSARRNDIFVDINMENVAESLFERELFGYRKGSFSDAKTNKTGRFELASGGTLFLDEIGNLSSAMQKRILTVLQNRQVTPAGTLLPVNVDVRLICATNTNIDRLVNEGLFCNDLFSRINAVVIEIPPLRAHPEDIPALVGFFVAQYNLKYAKNTRLSDTAIIHLTRQSWPGNIRQLKQTIEKAVILADDDAINEIIPEGRKTAKAPINFNLDENEEHIIRAALQHSSGNISTAAEKLGVNRSTLYEKMKKHEI